MRGVVKIPASARLTNRESDKNVRRAWTSSICNQSQIINWRGLRVLTLKTPVTCFPFCSSTEKSPVRPLTCRPRKGMKMLRETRVSLILL